MRDLSPLTKCNKGVWSDQNLTEWAQGGGVEPFDAACINPASMDLRVGNLIRTPYSLWSSFSRTELLELIECGGINQIPKWSEPIEFESFWLMPQGKGDSFVLCHSLEFVSIPDDSIALLFSKSSTGRVGLEHLHAGLGDSSFNGQWVFELHNVAPWPIELVAGKRVMQEVHIKMTGKPLKGYDITGRYQGQTGPTPAR